MAWASQVPRSGYNQERVGRCSRSFVCSKLAPKDTNPICPISEWSGELLSIAYRPQRHRQHVSQIISLQSRDLDFLKDEIDVIYCRTVNAVLSASNKKQDISALLCLNWEGGLTD